MLVVACALLYALDFYNMPDNDSLKPLLPYAALCGVIGISMIAGAVIGAIADAIKNCQKRIAERKKKQDAYDKDGIAAVAYVKHLEKTHIYGLALIINRYESGSFVVIHNTKADDRISKNIITKINDTGYEQLCFVHPKVIEMKSSILEVASQYQSIDLTLKQFLTERVDVW